MNPFRILHIGLLSFGLLTLGTFNNAAWAQDESATEEVAAGSDECKKEFQIFTDNAKIMILALSVNCLLYTSDAADE